MSLTKENAFKRLGEASSAGRLAHAYLFAGDVGSGKDWLVERLSALVLQEDPEKILSHPDFHAVEPGSKLRRITTDKIRELEQSLQMKPLIGRCKVAVIRDADRLQPQAANAFLKTLEEPPEGCHIFLTSALREAILPTILSRCITVPLRSPDSTLRSDLESAVVDALAQALLQNGGPDLSSAMRFTRFFQGTMAEFRERVADELEDVFKAQVKHYKDSIDSDWRDAREEQIKAQGEAMVVREREACLGIVGSVLGGALREKIRPDSSCPEPIRKIAAVSDVKTLLRRIEALERTRRLLASGVQEALALESGFLKMISYP